MTQGNNPKQQSSQRDPLLTFSITNGSIVRIYTLNDREILCPKKNFIKWTQNGHKTPNSVTKPEIVVTKSEIVVTKSENPDIKPYIAVTNSVIWDITIT